MRRALALLLFGGGVYFLYEGGSSFLTQFRPAPYPSIDSIDSPVEISFPRLGAQFYVSPGADKDDLLHGPGHVPGTSTPGARGNVVIAGHRDTHFRILKDVKKDDEIVIEKGWKEYRYRVTETKIIAPTQTSVLGPSPRPMLTLVTCYPFYYAGPAPKRFIVRAVLTAQVTHSIGSPGRG